MNKYLITPWSLADAMRSALSAIGIELIRLCHCGDSRVVLLCQQGDSVWTIESALPLLPGEDAEQRDGRYYVDLVTVQLLRKLAQIAWQPAGPAVPPHSRDGLAV